MQTGTAKVENRMEFLKKLKTELPLDPVIPLLGMYPKTPIQKNICTSMFIAVLFTIAKIWTQPKCPSVDEWIKKAVVHLHNGILLGQKKKKFYPLQQHGEHYAKCNKPVRGSQVP